MGQCFLSKFMVKLCGMFESCVACSRMLFLLFYPRSKLCKIVLKTKATQPVNLQQNVGISVFYGCAIHCDRRVCSG